jgi:hypothetical protein
MDQRTERDIADAANRPPYVQPTPAIARTRQWRPPRVPLRVVTVRMPKELHALLLEEAYTRKTSLNQHCLDKLIRTLRAEE